MHARAYTHTHTHTHTHTRIHTLSHSLSLSLTLSLSLSLSLQRTHVYTTGAGKLLVENGIDLVDAAYTLSSVMP